MKNLVLLTLTLFSTYANCQTIEFFTNSRLILGTHMERTASIGLGDIDKDGDIDVIVANGRHWPGQNTGGSPELWP